MTYVIFTIAIVLNIFNIALISSRRIGQTIKEKVLLGTYSLAELIYIFYILSLIEYTTVNIVFVLSFIIIWLLSKAYILVVNMNFENIEDEGMNDMEQNNNLEQNINQTENNIEQCFNEEISSANENVMDNTELITTEEVDGSVETINENATDNVEVKNEEIIDNAETINNDIEEIEVVSEVDSEKLELSDIVESSLNNSQDHVVTRNSLYTLSDIVETAEINEAEKRRIRRRILALKASKMMNDEQ